MRVAAAVRPWLAGARRSLVVTVLAALTLAAAAVPAYAEVGVTTVSTIGTWIRYDDFMVVGTPSNPAPPINRWEIQGDGHFSLNSEWANSGSQYAYLRTNGSMNSFVRTTFDFPSRNMRGCTAWFAVRAVTKDARVGLLVWEPGNPVGAVYRFHTVRPSQGWVMLSAKGVPFEWGRETEAAISLLGGLQPGTGVTDIRVDDFRIQCWT